MIYTLKALIKEMKEFADHQDGGYRLHMELTKSKDRVFKETGSQGWCLFNSSTPYTIDVSAPLAAALQSWGWQWGYRKSVRMALGGFIRADQDPAKTLMCECGHWKANHMDYRTADGTQMKCYRKGCTCQNFKSAGL